MSPVVRVCPLLVAFTGESPVLMWSATATVGGGGSARSEALWSIRRMKMAPCGGAGCVAVLGREVTALLLAMWSTTATVGSGRGARSEALWSFQRREVAPRGGASCDAFFV
ncbi:Os01g0733801 [Oryza sativa Japonica Group]|uniref:Os01g0733801 protein n=1 Tax=Oryza sativa subsp. japonica TaxID=39947 RepID=A0A0P0V7U2_ORYSJ|nr:hypothetical protein DAI22_01g315100 [Oryza sativa Japonica Group]BAS74208.1 Os01g0733801 [Oryza sativa Japonica Group]